LVKKKERKKGGSFEAKKNEVVGHLGNSLSEIDKVFTIYLS
jgi:hypothetical protein